ncbi:hypothetical protein B0T26DRAFT_288483 [Lasiosphaeria miniovina]|uniref:Zn(2)-C6 fungal-type domain-containing protein n=1 Tax=Lasiosphaeria miniovina TaxID=1954250 RepID=A0AA40AK17_9PEZI|nr:uncharacterized protein B0T26DRAFT_288483 [Lasiosphaeria miniovina]KAK0717205.1 hypothetical protein B0T26DRAFT_288483 [Lasiosphaeria miniovina]
MADDQQGGRGYPPRDHQENSQYPSPPEVDDDRARQYPPPAAPGAMTLPSLQYSPPAPGYTPDPRYPDPRYSTDPRYAQDQRGGWSSESPTNANGYPPPHPDPRFQLAPVVPAHPPHLAHPAHLDRRQYDERRQHDERRQFDERRQYGDQYYQAQGPPPQGRAGSYGNDGYPYRYSPPAGYPYGNAPPQQPQPPQQQAAPRQRTSIACRYCRKRKIRCSGYANTPNGKCTNCDKLRIECVFQPVSSNSSTAFVPVSAVPGGVPPGTPLYGAYGQPLPPSAGQAPQPRGYPPSSSDYPPPLHSPTSRYPPPPYDDRDRDPGRRRTRPSDEGHGLRLPPPNYPPDEDPRRRSPVSNEGNGTPPNSYHQYQAGYEDRTPTPRHSPGGPLPSGPTQAAAPAPPPQQQQSPSQSQSPQQPQTQPQFPTTSNPMSLNHLMGGPTGPGAPESRDRGSASEIDRNMLGRLNRRS